MTFRVQPPSLFDNLPTTHTYLKTDIANTLNSLESARPDLLESLIAVGEAFGVEYVSPAQNYKNDFNRASESAINLFSVRAETDSYLYVSRLIDEDGNVIIDRVDDSGPVP